MSGKKHTEGPLKLCEVGDKCKHLCPATMDDVSIFTVAIEYGDDGEPTYYGAVYNPEDARRIVACWNRLLPFSTDEIETEIDLTAVVQQRDILLEALRHIESYGCGSFHPDAQRCGCYAEKALAEIRGM